MNYLKKIGKVNFVILLGAILLIIYIEVLHYKVVSSNWRQFPKSKILSVKILFVSDSQLLGLNDEPSFFGYLTRWDSDRYLTKGFRKAMNHVGPDAVVFLGDLFDEGSSSTDLQFESYVKRFSDIFQLPSHVKEVFVPGDNDIAREGFNFIERKKMERFNKFFPSLAQPVTSVGFVDILKFENYNERIDQVKFNSSRISAESSGRFKIFCNHFGVLNYLPRLHKTMKEIKPDIIIAGHEHESSHISCVDCWSKKRRLFLNRLDQDDVLLGKNLSNFIDSRMDQIVVPTCNYRMGYPKMGYGFMQIDYSGGMTYTVLWLPDRYRMLNIYSGFCYLSLLVILLQFIFNHSDVFYNAMSIARRECFRRVSFINK